MFLKDSRVLSRVFTAPRIEILESLQLHGASTVASLAERLGRAPDALYHHLRQLEKDAVVERRGSRKSGGRDAAVFVLAAPSVHAQLEPSSPPSFRKAWAKAAGAVLRACERELRDAAEEGRASSHGPDGNIRVGRSKAWLTDRELRKFRRRFQELWKEFSEHKKPRKNTKLYTWTSALAPLKTPDES